MRTGSRPSKLQANGCGQIIAHNTEHIIDQNLSITPKVNPSHFKIPKRSCFSPQNQNHKIKPLTTAREIVKKNLNRSTEPREPTVVPWERLINYDKIMFDKVNEHEQNQLKKEEFRKYLNFQVVEKQKRNELESKISQLNEI
jgi:hypothetical protein